MLTLIATPVVYSLLDDLRHTARWRRFASATGEIRVRLAARLAKRSEQPEKVSTETTAETRGVHDDERKHVAASLGGD